MTKLLALLLVVTGCSAAEQPVPFGFDVVGRLEDKKIREASGLARSQSDNDLLWIINDNGSKPRIHAIDKNGARRGEVDIKNAKNRDWEDLASFETQGSSFLMVADIGDNDAKRKFRSLYLVPEPAAEKNSEALADQRIDYYYPDGPRDAESAAVDVDANVALVLSKRDRPPQLYTVPLNATAKQPIAATYLGTIESLTKPSQHDLDMALRLKDWFWQPVGMDISSDNRAAVILTYRAVYYYERSADETWFDALNKVPVRVSLGNFKNAESVSFGDAHREVFVTGENKHSRLLRVDFNDREKP